LPSVIEREYLSEKLKLNEKEFLETFSTTPKLEASDFVQRVRKFMIWWISLEKQ
jgi:hypothetical protein